MTDEANDEYNEALVSLLSQLLGIVRAGFPAMKTLKSQMVATNTPGVPGLDVHIMADLANLALEDEGQGTVLIRFMQNNEFIARIDLTAGHTFVLDDDALLNIIDPDPEKAN